MRTQEEIKRQIVGLEKEKLSLPVHSHWGDPNHDIIDAKISILDGSKELSDIDEGDWDEMDADNKIYRGAEEADNWLQLNDDEDLFSEY